MKKDKLSLFFSFVRSSAGKLEKLRKIVETSSITLDESQSDRVASTLRATLLRSKRKAARNPRKSTYLRTEACKTLQTNPPLSVQHYPPTTIIHASPPFPLLPLALNHSILSFPPVTLILPSQPLLFLFLLAISLLSHYSRSSHPLYPSTNLYSPLIPREQ